MQQLTWTFCHDIGQGWMRSGFHFAMPTRSTNQILIKAPHGQSSDNIETIEVRKKIKAQVSQPPVPPPQLSRRTSHQTTRMTKGLGKSA
jgi:hypothetical protein